MNTVLSNAFCIATVMVLAALGTQLAGCGGKESDEQLATQSAPAGTSAQKKPVQAHKAQSAQSAAAGEDDSRMANAVVTGKTAAAVDLKYDMAAKPAVGQPFEVELAFAPRLPADSLDVEISGMPGLTLVSGGTAHFEKVVPGQTYTAKVLVSAAEAGLYYVGIVAKMATQVQTDARTFSVPLVIGTPPPAAEKPAPQKDASGRPIESMPAKEPPAS